jgi:valyl-tRNA synthetase
VRGILDDPRTAAAREEIGRLVDAVTTARALKAQFKLPPRQPTRLLVRTGGAAGDRVVERIAAAVERLAGAACSIVSGDVPREAAVEVVRGWEYAMPLEGLVDVATERARLGRELGKHEADIAALERKLANPGFVAKAPPPVVAGERARLGELQAARDKLRATLARLA